MKKTIGFLLVFLCVVSLVFGQVQYKRFYRLGIAPMAINGVKTPEQVRHLLKKEELAIRLILRNYDISESIFEQIDQAEIEGVVLKSGNRFEAMAFKVFGRIKTTGRVQWAGREPIDAFCFSLNTEKKRYVFVVPKICGNITLWKVEDIIQEFEEFAKIFIPEITERPEELVEPIKKPVLFEGEKEKSRTSFFLDLALGAFRGCHQEYSVGRIGLKYRLLGECFLMLSPGISFPIGKDAVEWKRVYHGDVTFFYDFGVISIGLGAGYSSKVREFKKEQMEFVVNLGLNLKERVNLFVEGRLPTDSDSPIKDNHKIICGIRYFL